jgi:hypothetical protein
MPMPIPRGHHLAKFRIAGLDYASSFDPLAPTSDFVGYCGMIFGA